MFVHLAIHHPKPEYAADLLASMQRASAAAEGAPGLIEMSAWLDQRSGRLIGLGKWESQAAFQAGAGRIFAVVADDPFDLWCEQPSDMLHLTQPSS